MKKIIALVCAFLIICVYMLPVYAAELSVSVNGPVVPAPAENDITYSFGFSAPDAEAAELMRRETYKTARERYSDAEIASSPETDWLLCPVEAACLLKTDGGISLPVSYVNVTDGGFTVSLFKDILPALAKNGLYTGEMQNGFSFHFTIELVLNINGRYSVLSGECDIPEDMQVPETAFIDYDLPLDADNGGNPVFLFYPYEGDIILSNPTRTGYTFTGWVNANGDAVDRIPAGTRYIKIGAGWSSRTHKVSYVLTTRSEYSFIRCKNSNPYSFSSSSGLSLLSPDAPSGWVFSGWFDNAELEGEPVTEIAPGTDRDIILYAKWKTAEEALNEKIAAAKWGDLDSDGSITAADARIALRAAVGLEQPEKDITDRADFLKQGRLTSAAARTLLRIAVGLDSLKDVLTEYGLI